MVSMWMYAALAFALYIARVRQVRFRKLNYIEKRYGNRYALSDQQVANGKERMIDSYRGVRDAQRIVRLMASWDAPFVFTKALEVALFRTYGIPTISSLLLHTGQFSKADNAPRRYVDTSALIQSFMTYPLPRFDYTDDDVPPPSSDWETNGEDLDDPRSSIALARVNYLHGRWKSKISNDDLLYTLSVFYIEPAKWIDRYEWRATTALEKEALFSLFYHVGRCMGIENIPTSAQAFTDWSVEYEEQNMVYTEANASVAKHTIDLLLYSLPKAVHGFATQLVASIMDPRLRNAMGLPTPPAWIVSFKDNLFAVRAFLTRYLVLPRSKGLNNIATGNDKAGSEFSIESILSKGVPGVCPASGARASDGRPCPVGSHSLTAEKTTGAKASPWRMELKWYENDPIYSRPYVKWSTGWAAEEIKIVLGLLSAEHRRGASKWRSSALPGEPRHPVQGLGGFRLEELGPHGLELKGRQEVLADAKKLNAGPLSGVWAFEA